jgi:hypothetical protein
MLGNDRDLHQYWSSSSSTFIPYPTMFSTMSVSTIETQILTTPNVLKTAKDHFSCGTLKGMPYIYVTE